MPRMVPWHTVGSQETLPGPGGSSSSFQVPGLENIQELGATYFWEDDQESFLEEAARQERHMIDSKAEGQVPVCQPITKMLSRERSWEQR